MMKTITFLLALAVSSVSWAQIVVPASSELYKPIIAQLGDPIPEGAQVQGGWLTPTAEHVQVSTKTIHIWAKPGSHIISFRGVWMKTRELTIEGQTVQVLEGFGFIDRQAAFQVQGKEPDPPNPPDPPVPGGPYQIMMFYDADQLDNLPAGQRELLTSLSLRQSLVSAGHVVLEILDESSISSNTPSKYKAFFDSVRGDQLPRIALAPKAGGKVDDYPLPESVEKLMQLLSDRSSW